MMPGRLQIASRFGSASQKGLQAKRMTGHASSHTDDRTQTQVFPTAPSPCGGLCAAVCRGGALVLGRGWLQAGAGHAALGGGEHRGFVFDLLPDRLGGVPHLAKRWR